MFNVTSHRGNQAIQVALVAALGVAAFLIFLGPRVLLPQNIAWLVEGDPAQHYLGWLFFRNSPWTFPLGLNPSLGLELSNGIAYSDSIPGLALLFKALSPALPEVFQYFGGWLFACFVLQAWFGWKLAGLVTQDRLARLLIAALFVSAPPLLQRTTHHLALSGHFLILAAIYLVLRPDRRHQALFWGLLLVAAALTNAYLLMMAGACWLADVAATVISRRRRWTTLVGEAIATVAAVSLALWQAGFFAESDKGAGGFGIYRFNLLSLIDAHGWSHVLPNLPGGPGDYEGFNFLGAGILMLAAVALAVLLSRRAGLARHVARWPIFVLLLVAFTAFAASHHIGIGPLELAIPAPDWLLDIASTFRASGRVFWPVFYVLVLAIAYLVVRGSSARVASALLGVALVLQIFDTSVYWRQTRAWLMTEPSPTWPTPLTSPFWGAAGARYTELRRILPQNVPPFWAELGYFAATHGMGTDIVYFPRIGAERLANARDAARESVKTGRYRPDSLYIVDPAYLARVAIALDPATDLFARFDGQYVVAPGWAACEACEDFGPPLGLGDVATPPILGEPIPFGSGEPVEGHLISGWSVLESWGIWSLGTRAELMFASPPRLASISLLANAFTPGQPAAQRVVVSINGIEALRTEIAGADQTIDIPVTDAMREKIEADRYVAIVLDLPDATSPQTVGLSQDDRQIAIGLRSATFR